MPLLRRGERRPRPLLPGLLDPVPRRGIEAWDALGETGFNSTLTGLLADTLARLGRFEEAESAASRSRELAAEDDFASQVAWRSAQARVQSARSEHHEGLRLLNEAVAIVGPTHYLDFQAETHVARGDVLRDAGRGDEARAAYRLALELVERKGAEGPARPVREALAALGDA